MLNHKMKKIISAVLILTCVFCIAACETVNSSESADSSDNTKAELEDNCGMIYEKYNLKTYLYPFWRGTTVYNETLWFAGGKVANLMYTPETILSVKSYDLSETYTENVDFVVEGKTLVLTDNSSIPYLRSEQFYPSVPNNPLIAIKKSDGSSYIYANEGTDVSSHQVVVTYTHSDSINWTKPNDCSSVFDKTLSKLKNGDSINVLFYGDSITVGANSSEFLNYGPKAESYANMVKSYIKKRYPSSTVNFTNNAVGGTDSNWGISKKTGLSAIDNISVPEGADGDHFKVRVLDVNPDLLFIGYGMNDQSYSSDTYENNISEMIKKARALNPNVEIMLVSTMIANPETGFYNKDYEAYQTSLSKLASKYKHVGVATVLNSVKSVYATGKRFTDCTANNVNHPNDFMMRVYAQTVIYSLFGEDYINYI